MVKSVVKAIVGRTLSTGAVVGDCVGWRVRHTMVVGAFVIGMQVSA